MDKYIYTRHLSRTLLLVCSSFIIQATALANTASYNLTDFISYALTNNPGLHALRQQVVAADQNEQVHDKTSVPTLSVSHSVRLSDDPLDAFANKLLTRQISTVDFNPAILNNPTSSELFITKLSLRWPIYAGGRLTAEHNEAKHAYTKSTQHLYRGIQKTVFETTKAYLLIIASDEANSILESAVESAEETVKTTTNLAKQGRIVESDKLTAQVNLAILKAEQEKSSTRLKHAYNQLKRITAFKESSDFSIEKIWPTVQPLTSKLSDLQKMALEQRNDLKAAKSAVASSKSRIKVAASINRPSVNVIANNNWYDNTLRLNNHSADIMLTASFNLYDATSNGKVEKARAGNKEMQWLAQELELSVQSEVQAAFDDISEAHKRYSLADANILRAKKVVNLVKKRYGQGRTILLDLLQSERMYTESRLEKLASKLAIQLSQLSLSYATGTLDTGTFKVVREH